MRAVHLLNVLYVANQARKDPLPNSEFYNKSVSRQVDLAHEYILWHRLLVRSFSFVGCRPTHHHHMCMTDGASSAHITASNAASNMHPAVRI